MEYFRDNKETVYYSYMIWKYIAEYKKRFPPPMTVYKLKREAVMVLFPEHLVVLRDNHYCPCCVEYFDDPSAGLCKECPGKPIWPKGCEHIGSPYQNVRVALSKCNPDVRVIKENATIIANHFRNLYNTL